MDRDTYLAHIGSDGERLIEVAKGAPAAAIPSCPEWDMRALVGHVASVHAWAANILENHLQTRPHLRRVDEAVGDFHDISADYESAFARLLAALEAAPDDDEVWNWRDRKPAPAAFWFRRMAQETAIHRVDAELGGGVPSPIEASLAADGIGEFLGLLQRFIVYEPVEAMQGSIAFSAADVGDEWRLALAPDHIEFIEGEVDATVRGGASDLYLWVLHRDDGDSAPLTVSGDRDVVERWRNVKFD
ncbi:MAG: maleylpyruvate isomerase family mycothiol-dependent enzyme [Acidimicrobiales bacterium]